MPAARGPDHDAQGADPGTWVIDLDGVVWLADEGIAGSAHAIARLRDAGYGVVFATNNAAPTVSVLLEKLQRVGIAAESSDLVTSAQAAASMLAPGSTVVVCGDDGLVEAMTERGVIVVPEGPSDAVAVGWTRRFDFDMLVTAVSAVRDGARLIGTNEDATYPTKDRLLPGAGSLLAAVVTASQRTPDVAGKPHGPMAELVQARTGHITLMVGDRSSTDGVFAQRLGVPFGLVRSGVTVGGHEPMVVRPDEDAADLAALVAQHLGD